MQLVDRVREAGGETMDLRVTNVPELADIPALLRLIGLMRRIRPDVVHTHSSKAGALGRFAALLLRHRNCFYSPHAYYGMAKPASPKVRFYNQIERLLGKFGTTIAISEDEALFARNVLRVSGDHIHIVHNPVDTNYFVPVSPEQRRTARAALDIPEQAIVLAIIGRMCWQKDPETAYAGVAPVCVRNPDLLLLHLGWGKWREYLQGYSQRLGMGRQLRIVEYTDDPRAFYHAIDALLVSSRYEAGWPLVFLEAMACNLPVIATTGLGMSDVGRAKLSHVWTFPAEDVQSCTTAVTKWLARQREGIRGCNHSKFAIERFSPDRCYGALFNLYRNVEVSGSVSPLEKIPDPS
jgi:glycosyltransferase involved in cell wall biosynthesis